MAVLFEKTMVYKILLFILGSTGIILISHSSFYNIRQHGFFRFLTWELILILFLINLDYWFIDPFKLSQAISWFFLTISQVFITQAEWIFRNKGMINSSGRYRENNRTGDKRRLQIYPAPFLQLAPISRLGRYL